MSYILERTVLGWCWWDLVALIVLVGVCVYSYLKIRKMKEVEKKLSDRLAGIDAEAAVAAGSDSAV